MIVNAGIVSPVRELLLDISDSRPLQNSSYNLSFLNILVLVQ
ncbi:hypothetical protein SAMN02745202_02573 [Segatella oulorum]|uniref:Uncharacterized protein n=1 Tax=Segatella oulorum TaxID=28136 RepID=A0A1T4S5W7_9BACT|nr:hypothetical protein SAMN02745202_02573 [Segatella oulorum]